MNETLWLQGVVVNSAISLCISLLISFLVVRLKTGSLRLSRLFLACWCIGAVPIVTLYGMSTMFGLPYQLTFGQEMMILAAPGVAGLILSFSIRNGWFSTVLMALSVLPIGFAVGTPTFVALLT